MRFKLLRVRPHIWFFKQNEPSAKNTSDDSSTDQPGLVYRRSPSMKLVNSSIPRVTSLPTSRNHGKASRVCTVVDAGCTCRATVTSQHKQKKALAAAPPRPEDCGSKHDACRPRWTHDGAKLRGSIPSLRTGNSMASCLVCKSSDVVNNSVYNAGHDTNEATMRVFGTVGTIDVGKERDMHSKAYADVHALECRLRNAGLEERRRRKKRNNFEEGPLISSGVSSTMSTSTIPDTINTCDTSGMQEMVMNVNPEFDMADTTSIGESMLSLDYLRASIAQRKLASQSSSSRQEDLNSVDGMRENETTSTNCSPSSVSLRKIKCDAIVASTSPLREPARGVEEHRERPESVKHVDVGIINRHVSPCNSHADEGLIMPAENRSEIELEDWILPRRTMRRIKFSSNSVARKCIEAHNAAMAQPVESLVNSIDGLSDHSTEISTFDQRECNRVVGEDVDDDHDQLDKQVVLSSSCEIKVLGDKHGYARHSAGLSSSATSPSKSPWAKLRSRNGAVGGGMQTMMSNSAVAMVKSSYDPHHDFKESMLEMVVAKQLSGSCQLQQLLQCYLSLNPSNYHPIIIKVFQELCSELFN